MQASKDGKRGERSPHWNAPFGPRAFAVLRVPTLALPVLAALVTGAPVMFAQAPAPQESDRKVIEHVMRGHIRSATGAPVAGALVRVVGAVSAAVTDSAGSYTLQNVSAGLDTLQITRLTFAPLQLSVLVPRTGSIRVDLVLTSEPVTLATIRISTLNHVVSDDANSEADNIGDPGEWSWTGDVTSAPGMTGEPDIYRVLSANSRIVIHPDEVRSTSLGVGPGSQPAATLVDGLPMWDPGHTAGILSGISPDMVGGLRFYDGTSSSRYGRTMSGTVDVQTREDQVTKQSWSGSISSVAVRTAWASPFRVGNVFGHLLLAARRSRTRTLLDQSGEDPLSDRWADAGGVLALQYGRNTVRVVAMRSGDRIRAGVIDVKDLADTATRSGVLAGWGPIGTSSPARIPWSSATVGAVWTRQMPGFTKLETRIWARQFTAANGVSMAAPADVSDSARSVGIESDAQLGSTSIGASLDVTRTVYTTYTASNAPAAQAASGTLESGNLLHHDLSAGFGNATISTAPATSVLRSAPAVFAAYAEHRWARAEDAWSFTGGLRATGVLGRSPMLEPRLELATRLSRRTLFSMGYARAHEFVQSVWMTGAPLAALVPVALPIAASKEGVPVLASSITTARLTSRVADHVTLDVAAFEQEFRGLLTSPVSHSAFPASFGPRVASGHVTGASIGVQGDGARLAWNVAYRITRTNVDAARGADSLRRVLAQDATAALTLRADSHTDIRVASWFGRPQASEGELLGSEGRNELSAADTRAAPGQLLGNDPTLLEHPGAYMRLDIAAVHRWRVGSRGTFDISLTLENVLNRRNTAALLPDPGETETRVISFTPRALLAGISWHP